MEGSMRLMLAVDIDENGPERLVNEGVLWAQRLGAKLDLAFVLPGTWGLGAGADPEVRELIALEAGRLRAAQERAVDELLQTVPEENRGETIVLEGPPVQALVEASRSCDALLVGTHGRKGLARFWLGSVSEQLVRRAACTVITLRLYDTE